MTHFVYPLATEDSQYQTAIAVLNTSSGPANVVVELWAPDGSMSRSTSFTLQPGTRLAQYLTDFFPGVQPILSGNIRLRSDNPVHSFSLINDRGLHFLAAVPPIPFPE